MFNHGILFIAEKKSMGGTGWMNSNLNPLESITWATYNEYGGVIFAYGKTASTEM
jgi:hypothetical protein